MRAPRVTAGPLASGQFRAIVGTSLVVMLGFGLIIPALPLFARRFGVGEAAVGVMLMAFALTRLAGNVVTGPLIHHFGERLVSGVGLAVVGVSSIAAGMAGTYLQLVVFRAAGGVGSAFFFGGIMAHLVATVPGNSRGRTMGIFQSSINIGLLIGPAIGGALIAAADERAPLLVYGVVCLLCAPLISRALGPDMAKTGDIALDERADEAVLVGSPPLPRVPARHAIRPLLRDRAYIAAIACGALTFMQTSALSALMPLFWHEELGEAKDSVGLPFTVAALFSLVVLYHAGSLSDRKGRRYALLPGLAVMACTFGFLGFATSGVMVLVLMGVNGLASGYMRPNPSSMVADIATEDQRAVAVAGYRVSNDVGALIGPVLAGTIAQVWGFRSAFAAVGLVTAAVLAYTLTTRETHQGS